MVVDFHVHAFPDDVAAKAMPKLCDSSHEAVPNHDGTIKGLLESMDEAGIDMSVLCSIATKPEQFMPIINWSKNLDPSRIVALPSIYPVDSRAKVAEMVKIVHGEGFKGIKLHPYYQNFIMDELKLFNLYENLIKYDLFVVSHCGFDSAYPRDRIADPQKVLHVVTELPELLFVAAHFGGWRDWDEVEKHLIGKNIYIEISFALEMLGLEKTKALIMNHPADYLLFGTDSPWTGQKENINLFHQLELDTKLEDKILGKNAGKFLGIE